MRQPSLFVIGDSISLQYGPYLQTMLTGRFRYTRKTGDEDALQNLDHPAGANGGDSGMVLAYLHARKDDPQFRPEILLLNCGLHDIKTDRQTGEKQVTLPQYRENLQRIVEIVREIGARLIWVRTTPVDDVQHNFLCSEFLRYDRDVVAYNHAADDIMTAAGIPVIDLYGFTRNLGGEPYEDHVHFIDTIRQCQAAYLAGHLTAWEE
ncbi:MAG TPA: SGNH/GDSL hydrolase family protein [Armatimonadota bacterium]|jgi:lysophospholipase L1-like esterase